MFVYFRVHHAIGVFIQRVIVNQLTKVSLIHQKLVVSSFYPYSRVQA